jgi:hypothetical protein
VADTISEGGRSKKSSALAVPALLETAVLSRLAALSAVNSRLWFALCLERDPEVVARLIIPPPPREGVTDSIADRIVSALL